MITKQKNLIGIKQAIRFEWMEKTANLMLAGLDSRVIRSELHEYLEAERGDGSNEPRSKQTRTFAVNNLMNIWVSPHSSTIEFRNSALAYLQRSQFARMAVHWSMISATYPFWFNVARQTGRLLSLQDQVTQAQIASRLKEQYGDRETISRYARYVIRSFVAWGILDDTEVKGCYRRGEIVQVPDVRLAALLIEAALQTTPNEKTALGSLASNPGFFPFRFPPMTAPLLLQQTDRLDAIQSGLDERLLFLAVK